MAHGRDSQRPLQGVVCMWRYMTMSVTIRLVCVTVDCAMVDAVTRS